MVVPTATSQRFSHLQSDAETSLDRSDLLEPAREIEILGMRIPGYMERLGPLLACDLCAVFDHQPSNAMPANVWLDKKGIQFGFSVHSRLYGRETHCYATQLGHEYPPCCNLFQRDLDRIWIGKQRIAIARIGKRCTQLQCFKGLLLGHGSGANDNAVCHRQIGGLVPRAQPGDNHIL